MPQLSDGLIQLFQVGTILFVSPFVTGAIARAEAIVQQRHGPRLLQPYYDIAKLFRKETVLPEGAGPVFRAAPYVAFACYLTVPLLIPVLVAYPPQLAYMGDILGGGFLLSLASFSVSLAAIDSGSPYAQLGSRRVRSFGALAEPTILFVVFVVALTTQTDLPFAMVKTLESSTVEVLRPSHLLVLAAFFMVVLAETGRVPLENHGSTLEFGMIEEARVIEHSGPGLALLKWGSSMKQLILYVIFGNVLVAPWGLAADPRLDHNPLWDLKADCAFPSATQNEINAKDAANLLKQGVFVVSEGANMPCTIEATKAFLDAKILYGPGKAANAGGVATSGLEMSQNSMRLSWTRQEVDERLHKIMIAIHKACFETAERYGTPGNLVNGANIAGFLKVADAMMAQGVV